MVAFEKIKKVIAPLIRSKRVVVCTVEGCGNWTLKSLTTNPDVRKRWMVNIYIGDEEEHAYINLCPACVKNTWNLREEDYKSIERGEKLATGRITSEDFYAQIGGR
jgi:hypothetical protein